KVQSKGDVARGEVQFLESRRVTVEVPDRPERVWFGEKQPDEAKADGWKMERKDDRLTHTDFPPPGGHRHYFDLAPTGFQVQPGESLFAHVFIDPANPPETVMLQWNDGSGWEHRAFWGADKIKEGKPNSPARHHMGALPETGKWVRLE